MFPIISKAPEPLIPQRSNTSKRRAEPVKTSRKKSNTTDDFGDDGIDDDELVNAAHGDLEFEHIDNYSNPTDAITRKNTVNDILKTNAKGQTKTRNSVAANQDQESVQLSNGKWACKHACKDKNACRHLCCKEGMDKPPKKAALTKHHRPEDDRNTASHTMTKPAPKNTQSKLQLTATKRKIPSVVEELDLTQDEKKKRKADSSKNGPREYRELHQLHKSVQKKDPPSILQSVMHSKPSYCYSQGGEHKLSFLQQPPTQQQEELSDYGDDSLSQLPFDFAAMESSFMQRGFVESDSGRLANDLTTKSTHPPVASYGSDTFGDDDSLLNDAMIGLADSQSLQGMNDANAETWQSADQGESMDLEMAFQDEGFDVDLEGSTLLDHNFNGKEQSVTRQAPARQVLHQKAQARTLFNNSTSSCGPLAMESEPPESSLVEPVLKDLHAVNASSVTMRPMSNQKPKVVEVENLDYLNVVDIPPAEEQKLIPDAFAGIEPWLFEEYGDVVELVD